MADTGYDVMNMAPIKILNHSQVLIIVSVGLFVVRFICSRAK